MLCGNCFYASRQQSREIKCVHGAMQKQDRIKILSDAITKKNVLLVQHAMRDCVKSNDNVQDLYDAVYRDLRHKNNCTRRKTSNELRESLALSAILRCFPKEFGCNYLQRSNSKK